MLQTTSKYLAANILTVTPTMSYLLALYAYFAVSTWHALVAKLLVHTIVLCLAWLKRRTMNLTNLPVLNLQGHYCFVLPECPHTCKTSCCLCVCDRLLTNVYWRSRAQAPADKPITCLTLCDFIEWKAQSIPSISFVPLLRDNTTPFSHHQAIYATSGWEPDGLNPRYTDGTTLHLLLFWDNLV